jgi:serine/threonine protein kinase
MRECVAENRIPQQFVGDVWKHSLVAFMNWMREPDAEPLPGYRLIKPLGTGGFGEVWMCEAPGGIRKAIKFVYGNLNAEDGGNIRADQEYRALQKVKEVRHAFVLSIERIEVTTEGELLIVMELADKSLHDCMGEHQEAGRLGVPREHVLSYLSDAAEGLDYLVDRYSLLHLDIKPRNLFLIGNHVKVADFGLVKNLERHSSSGLMGGMSPMYAAPETFRGDMSRQSDQYSLGIVYMELITGQRPFSGRNIRQLALQHMSEEPDLRPLPESDRAIVLRCLSKDPAKRYPSCTAFVRALLGDNRRPEPIIDISEPTPLPRDVGNLSEEERTPPTARKLSGSSIPRLPREVEEPGGSKLNATLAQAEIGVLRPAVVIGIGEFGLKVLRELRSRLLDRLGDLSQTPAFRFVYIDVDPGGRERAMAGDPEQSLRDEQIFEMRLQPVANYRKRILEHLSEWLPREKLFSLPRSLHPQGSRALGRLAFCDNYLRFDSRFTREVKLATHPESLAQTMTHTGLNLRDNCPRVYVIASALGSSSGLLADMGFTIRRRLAKSNFNKAPVMSFLYCGSPNDPASPPEELANLYATITELHHFQDPAISFSAQYGGPDGPKLISQEWPFSSIYLMQRPNRSLEALTNCAANLAGYLVQDLSSPLGAELDGERESDAESNHSPFRGFGTAGIWFPKGLMLRSAARLMCERLLLDWQDPNAMISSRPIDELCDKVRNVQSFKPEAIAERIEQAAKIGQSMAGEALEIILNDLEASIPAGANEPAEWATKSVEKIIAFVGTQQSTESTASYLQSRLSRTLNPVVTEQSAEWTNKLASVAMRLMELPGRRIAAAEEGIKRLGQICVESASYVQRRLTTLVSRSMQAWANVRGATEVCVQGSGFRLFGSRPQRNLKTLSTELSAFALARLNELLVDATVRCFEGMATGLEERLRDLSFCRQRLAHLQQMLEIPSSGSHSGTGQVYVPQSNPGNEQILLPFGERDVEWAAARFVQGLKAEQWTRLDEVLHSLVLAPLGGLYAVCQKAGDLLRQLAGPLIDQTTAYLGNLLTVGDVSRAEFATAGGRTVDLIGQVKKCYDRAEPLISGSGEQRAYLVVPGSETGAKLGEQISHEMPGLKIMQAVGQTSDLMVCREIGNLSLTDVQELLGHCREAYQKLASKHGTSPHSRFDIVEWMPLDV